VAKNHWKYEGRPRYSPETEGYGTPEQWRSAFHVRMGYEEAKEYQRTSSRHGNNWEVLSEIAGVVVTRSSVWTEIKTAFRRASMNCHPDRVTQHGKSEEVATEEFKSASAAFAMLEHTYRTEGRLR
jgi:DnaJ domain